MSREWLYPLSRCPVTHTTLQPAGKPLLERVNQAISDTRIVNRDQQPVTEPLEAGVVNADETLLYPVRDSIPVLVPGEAIPLSFPDQ